jgi:putative transposase
LRSGSFFPELLEPRRRVDRALWAVIMTAYATGTSMRTRRLDHQPFVYVWLDATYVRVREHRHVVSKAVVIATGLRTDGHREVLGVDVGD